MGMSLGRRVAYFLVLVREDVGEGEEGCSACPPHCTHRVPHSLTVRVRGYV